MRIGGGIVKEYQNPVQWYQMVEELGYRAVLAPVDYRAGAAQKEEYLECIRDHKLVIGEVGAWCNPLSNQETERRSNIEYCQNQAAEEKNGMDFVRKIIWKTPMRSLWIPCGRSLMR